MNRRLDRAARREFDRAGHADRDADHAIGAEPELRELGEEVVADPAEDQLGALRDRALGGMLGEHAPGEVGHREPIVVGAEIGGEHHAARRVQPQRDGRATPGRSYVAVLDDDAELEQAADPLRHRRAREPGGARDLGARDRPLRIIWKMCPAENDALGGSSRTTGRHLCSINEQNLLKSCNSVRHCHSISNKQTWSDAASERMFGARCRIDCAPRSPESVS